MENSTLTYSSRSNELETYSTSTISKNKKGILFSVLLLVCTLFVALITGNLLLPLVLSLILLAGRFVYCTIKGCNEISYDVGNDLLSENDIDKYMKEF